MSKLRKKPNSIPVDSAARFDIFGLSENPFPSEPTVNKDSADRRINGEIYEDELRQSEMEQIINTFVRPPLAEPNHTRLGYIIDTSYIGRGNGKSAFLVNLHNLINDDYGLNLSNDVNKLFAIYVAPEAGGRTKSFSALTDVIFDSIYSAGVINDCLTILRHNGIVNSYPNFDFDDVDDDTLSENLQDSQWYKNHHLDLSRVREMMRKDENLQGLPPEFPLFKEISPSGLFSDFVTAKDFLNHYASIKRGMERLDFVYTYLVYFFRSAGFSGSLIFIDDFERIPDFQSARQRKDFALELRTSLFDGRSANARVGFYNMILVLHAGVPPLISDAWSESGIESRAPITQPNSTHIIRFEKLSQEHASLLLAKYLNEYRLNFEETDSIEPFTQEAIKRIAESCEFNAARILKMAYNLIEHAALEGCKTIDERFVESHHEVDGRTASKSTQTISNTDSVDLHKKASERE